MNPAFYTVYADYLADGTVTQATISLPDSASYDQVADAVRILFRAGVLAAQDADRSLASTKVMQAPLSTNSNGYSYLNQP